MPLTTAVNRPSALVTSTVPSSEQAVNASVTMRATESATSRDLAGLPTAVTGMASMMCTAFGAAAGSGACSLPQRRRSASVTGSVASSDAGPVAGSGRATVTYATGTSPECGSGRPTTAAPVTAGWASRDSSTGIGSMLCPPRMIRSLARPCR